MSYHRVCSGGGKYDGKPSETESQKRVVERELHDTILLFFLGGGLENKDF